MQKAYTLYISLPVYSFCRFAASTYNMSALHITTYTAKMQSC